MGRYSMNKKSSITEKDIEVCLEYISHSIYNFYSILRKGTKSKYLNSIK